MAVATIPATLDEITPAWLTESLRESGALDAAAVTRVEKEVIGEGVGFVGLLARLTLAYDGAADGAPRSLVVKLPTALPEARALAAFFRLYDREVRFYRELAAQTSLRTPRCYAAQIDPATGNFVLLLEDLAAARLGDQLAACSLADARLVVEQLACFHAEWWESPRLDALDWIPNIDDPLNRLAGPQLIQTLPVLVERYGEYVPQEIRDAILHYGQNFDAALEAWMALPKTITHSDFRLDNMFFTDDPAAPLAVIDWQLMLRATGAGDLAYFMSMSLEPELRRAHEQELLDLYHRTLVAGGVQGYSAADLAAHYRFGLNAGLLMPIAVANLDTANERGVQLFITLIKRMVAALMDHRAWELLP